MTEQKVVKSKVDSTEATKSDQTQGDLAAKNTCHHHSWLGRHFCVRNFKKLGALGVVIFVLHILFHVVEVLLIPAILVWLGHK